MSHKAYLLTGANLGNRAANLARARELIGLHAGRVEAASALYETAAWGKEDQPAFLNQALVIRTELSPRRLLRRLLKLERQMGRIRGEKYGPRLIDMDILLYDQEVHQYPLLTLPHPALPGRRFALLPLAEIAPGLVHPVLQKSIAELLEECPDTLAVKKYS